MKRIKLTESDLYKIVRKVIKEDEESEIESQIMNSEEFLRLSDDEMMEWDSTQISWRKAIKECLAELDMKFNTTRYSKLPKSYIPILAFAAFLLGFGIYTNINELKFGALLTLLSTAVLSHVELQEILICAANKRKGKSQSTTQDPGLTMEPNPTMIESMIRKSLKKIIKEESEASFEAVLKKGKSFNDSKRKRFAELCRECIQDIEKTEPGFSRNMRVQEILSGYSLAFLMGAALLGVWPVVILAGAGLISTLGVEIVEKWKRVIKCVKSKRAKLIQIQSTN